MSAKPDDVVRALDEAVILAARAVCRSEYDIAQGAIDTITLLRGALDARDAVISARTRGHEPLTQPAALFWRLPVIRHVRWLAHVCRVNRWYDGWRSIGYYENDDFDRCVLEKIWKGVV